MLSGGPSKLVKRATAGVSWSEPDPAGRWGDPRRRRARTARRSRARRRLWRSFSPGPPAGCARCARVPPGCPRSSRCGPCRSRDRRERAALGSRRTPAARRASTPRPCRRWRSPRPGPPDGREACVHRRELTTRLVLSAYGAQQRPELAQQALDAVVAELRSHVPLRVAPGRPRRLQPGQPSGAERQDAAPAVLAGLLLDQARRGRAAPPRGRASSGPSPAGRRDGRPPPGPSTSSRARIEYCVVRSPCGSSAWS